MLPSSMFRPNSPKGRTLARFAAFSAMGRDRQERATGRLPFVTRDPNTQ
jgi:hypothetical protein